MPASQALPSESLPTVNLAMLPRDYAKGQPQGSGGDPKVIARRFKRKKNFVTYGRTDEGWTDRRDSRNSVVDWLTWGGTCGPNGQKHLLKFLGLKCNPSNLQKAHFFCNLLQIIYLFQ